VSVLESSTEGNASTYAESIGYISLKVRVTGQRGWPDHVFINPYGYHVWIEFKKDKKKPTKLQDHRLKTLTEQGTEAHWTDNLTRAKEILDAAVDTTRLPAPRN
jgi:hypothetical protein